MSGVSTSVSGRSLQLITGVHGKRAVRGVTVMQKDARATGSWARGNRLFWHSFSLAGESLRSVSLHYRSWAGTSLQTSPLPERRLSAGQGLVLTWPEMGVNLLHGGTQGCSSRRQIIEDLHQKACQKGASSLGQRRWHVGGEHQGILAQGGAGSQNIGGLAVLSLKIRV